MEIAGLDKSSTSIRNAHSNLYGFSRMMLVVGAPPLPLATHIARIDSVTEPRTNMGWASWLGRQSYAVYLQHLPVLHGVMRVTGWGAERAAIIAVPVILLLAEASLRWVESPALRFRDRRDEAFTRRNPPSAAQPFAAPAKPASL